MSYLPLEESYIWKFHVTIFAALSLGKIKSILTFRLVAILPACWFHCISESSFESSFVVSLPVTIVDLHPLSNNIQNILKLDVPFYVFIHLCRIVKWWIFKLSVHPEGFITSCSKFYLAILFGSFPSIQFIPFCLFISYILFGSLSNAWLCHSFSSIIILSSITARLHKYHHQCYHVFYLSYPIFVIL